MGVQRSQMKGTEAAVQWPNESSKVKTGGVSVMQGRCAQWTVELFSGIKVKIQKTFTSKSCY